MYLSGLVEVKAEVRSRCSSWWPSSLAAGWVSWPGWSWQGGRWWSWSLWWWWQGRWRSWWLWLWWQGTWWSWWRFCRGFALFPYCVNFIYQQRSLSGIIVVAEVVFSGYSPLSVFTSGVLRSTTNIYNNKYMYSKYAAICKYATNIFRRQQWSLLKFILSKYTQIYWSQPVPPWYNDHGLVMTGSLNKTLSAHIFCTKKQTLATLYKDVFWDPFL